ncbi:hypothetical protein GH714_018891 [Hevea brasiliensis]|uniref:Plastocyanin-like domain-containing protein n=1 Tax=Hevea brasiliensis TaxID=3981 RepID=A0A6A6K6E3_HEVBR|nr:hypothetical protein GH714_018891 [Hevea brasiliensis]
MVKPSHSMRIASNLLAFSFFFLFLSFISIPVAEATVHYHKWDVKYEFKSPDCYKKLEHLGLMEQKGLLSVQLFLEIPSNISLLLTGLEHTCTMPIMECRERQGFYGSIRVSLPDGESEPFAYDYDRSIILTDWYHNSTYEQSVGLSSNPFVWVGEPHSLLIQGKGKFDCSTPGIPAGVCNASNPECSPYAMTIVPGKTYRLRVSSLTALSALVSKLRDII